MEISANRGEWSELYVLLKILSENKLYGSDEDLEIDEDVIYNVLEVITNYDTKERLDYGIKEDKLYVFNPSTELTFEINKERVKELVKILYHEVVQGKGRSFKVDHSKEILNVLKRSSIKATSSKKSDLKIRVHDVIGNDPLTGFSIKSYIGGAPTLFNASTDNTNLVFNLENFHGDIKSINSITGHAKYRRRISKLYTEGILMKYKDIKSRKKTFVNNLDMIDDQLIYLLAEMVKTYYSGNGASISEITKYLILKNPMELYFENFNPMYYEYKIKNLLLHCALGMTAAMPWQGKNEVNGGFIAARKDGELVCFPVIDFEELKVYLFNNTFIDTPSSGRHKFGVVEKDGENFTISLNFQIRFR